MYCSIPGYISGEILTLNQLSARLSTPDKAVILSDSSLAIQALQVTQTKVPESKISGAAKQNSTKVVFQWVFSNCGLWGNEMVDLLAKKSTDISRKILLDTCLFTQQNLK
ncbi:hypothetical protein TNCV_5108261 [Trichonephila clavipes]|nr:hypothetical protein TNCV_5108261 [Trichonephila clavipes]